MLIQEELSKEVQQKLFDILQVGYLTVSYSPATIPTPYYVFRVFNISYLKGWAGNQRKVTTPENDSLKTLIETTHKRLIDEGHMNEKGHILTKYLLTYQVKQLESS